MRQYTKEQLAQIIKQVQVVSIDALPVFQVSIINAHNDEPIDLNQIQGSGVVYIKIEQSGVVGNFPIYVVVEQEVQ